MLITTHGVSKMALYVKPGLSHKHAHSQTANWKLPFAVCWNVCSVCLSTCLLVDRGKSSVAAYVYMLKCSLNKQNPSQRERNNEILLITWSQKRFSINLSINLPHPLWRTEKGTSGFIMSDSTTDEAHYHPAMDSQYFQLTFTIAFTPSHVLLLCPLFTALFWV